MALLQDRDTDLELVEYLKTPLTLESLRELLGKLGLCAHDIVRSNEPEFKESGLSLDAPDNELLRLIVTHPNVLQRPIVEHGARAKIGRPPEDVLELFE